MNEQELKDALSGLSVELEGKSSKEIKTSLDAFETKFNESIASQLTGTREGLEEKIKEIQDHADALDVRLKEKSFKEGPKDELKGLITDNFNDIKSVRKGKSVELELKVVADMTLATALTGDQPRVYDTQVTMIPRDMVNFVDLIRSFPIAGGTFTYPLEGPNEGAPAIQTEGAAKAQVDYDFTMVDINTDFLAGFCVYSKKMANNLPFLENFLPQALRRDYFKAENSRFYTDAVAAIPTSAVGGSNNEVENIISNSTALMSLNHMANAVVVNPAQYGAILVTAGPAGTGDYSLPGVVSINNGVISINGIAVIPATWVPAQKYIIGDWSKMAKIVTQGLGVSFFEQDSDNVRKNNITARVESQTALAVFDPTAFFEGSFDAI